MGYKSSKTTDIYTHVAMKDLRKIKSPLDSLQIGEVSVISLAGEKTAIAIVDDRIVRLYAKGLGIKTVHSTFLVFLALEKGLISKQKARDVLDLMIDAGWRCDVETYKDVLQVIDRIG